MAKDDPIGATAKIIGVDPGPFADLAKPYLADLNDARVQVQILQDSSRLFPAYKGPTELPGNFDSPTPADFRTWHSANQVKYVEQKGTDGVAVISDGGTPPHELTAVLAASGDRVYILEQLKLSDFSIMPKADQDKIVKLDAFQNGPAIGLGLSGDAQGSVRLGLQNIMDQALADMKPSGILKDDKLAPFTKEVELLKASLDDSSIFNAKEIKDKLQEIQVRYKRAAAFGAALDYDRTKTYQELKDAITPAQDEAAEKKRVYDITLNQLSFATDPATIAALQAAADKAKKAWDDAKLEADRAARAPALSLNSLDHGATMQQGFDIFIEQEQRMASLKEDRQAIMRNSALSLPQKAMALFLNWRAGTEAINADQNEEIRQYEKLADTYKAMQDQLAKQISAFSVDHVSVKSINDKTNIDQCTEDEKQLLRMFDPSTMGTLADGTLHPLEILMGRPRQSHQMLGQDGDPNKLILGNPDYWTQFQSKMNEGTTDLTNNINEKTNLAANTSKQVTQFSDAANNAYEKYLRTVHDIQAPN